MNGRLYDPDLGRFISADPFVKFVTSTQGFNRYSYTDNNPLSRMDLNGYGWFKKLKKKIKKAVVVIAVVAAVAYTGGAAYGAFMASQIGAGMAIAGYSGGVIMATAGAVAGAATGAAMGGVMGYAATGTLSGALAGAATGAVTGAITGGLGGGINALTSNQGFVTQTFGKATVSGISSRLNGGSFTGGFKAGLTTAVAFKAYESFVGFAANPNPGGDAVAKDAGMGAVDGANNFALSRSSDEFWADGWSDVEIEPSTWQEGGSGSRAMNNLSTMNSLAGFHDTVQQNIQNAFGTVADKATNILTMLPAGQFNAVANMYAYPSATGIYAANQ